jgi:capsular polysaccharide biosynthesis protein
VSVIVSEQDAPFKRATLRACGIADERVVWLPDFAAARAERLLVPRDCRAIPHPAHKAAPWALDFLRSRVGLAAPLGRPTPRKLYVSRADAAGRRVLNEDAVMRVLAPLGYHSVTLSGRSVAEQAALFAGASRVVGPHGAGLTNIVFAPPGARLLEILPRSYGTPAFYLLAAGGGVEYASYVAADVRPGGRDQVDDVVIDLADFVRCCGALL